MRQKINRTVMIVACVCGILLLTPTCTVGVLKQRSIKQDMASQGTAQSQHWALLFAVGVYLNHPEMDREEMLTACDNLYSTLISSSDYWQPSNIKVVKGSDATLQNLIKGLLWLRQNAKNEDYVLVYITTHGGQLKNKQGLPRDLPPKDEADGSDEVLAMYNGFDKWYGNIWDDALNFFLSIIHCKGLCLMVDSCYSGGFNDPPLNARGLTNDGAFTAASFTEGFVSELSAENRIVLMSAQEDCLSFSTYFSMFLTEGFSGLADLAGNLDGVNSAEEAFNYAAPLTEFWVWFFTGFEQHPTISDLYPGEFPVTTQ